MESLRWILLTAGIIFVIVIYVIGRSRRRRSYSTADELPDGDDLPEFSAQSLDDVDEGVGEVRVVTRSVVSSTDDDLSALNVTAEGEASAENSEEVIQKGKELKAPNDIIVLYILPKGDQTLAGSQINSSAQAMGLSFGEMNIFHYLDNKRSVFSLANMLEPGSFDANTIHDLKTTGLTVFMQMQKGDPLDDLTEMLQRSYQLAGLLDARLCNHKREPLTEQHAENYRVQVREFIEAEPSIDSTADSTIDTPELSNET